MVVKYATQQIMAGLILGLSAVIYAVSNGALLVAGPLSDFIGWGIGAALLTVAGGMVLGFLLEEPACVGGTDSNTVSVLATVLTTAVGVTQAQDHRLHLLLALTFMSTIICGLVFLAVGKFRLGQMVRLVPMPVTAGFLAATGWVMVSGALNIISGTPLTMAGISAFIADPVRPELAAGIIVAAALFTLSRVMATTFLIPIIVIGCTLAAILVFKTSICTSALCATERWLFVGLGDLPIYGPWNIQITSADAPFLLGAVPALFVVSFVAMLTVLISVAGLELQFGREYNLEKASLVHSGTSVGLAAVGGFVQVLSIGRTTLNHALGGGRGASAIAAVVCLAVLLGGGPILAFVPRAALGGLVLFVGATMLRTWLWDMKGSVSRMEYAQSFMIFLVIVYFGYVIGFIVGVLAACFAFVLAYSSISPARITGEVGGVSSSVVRSAEDVAVLLREGEKIPVVRLQGHLFFGSAMKLEKLFDGLSEGKQVGLVLDFGGVAYIDRSAAGALQRVLRRHIDAPVTIYMVYSAGNRAALEAIAKVFNGIARVMLFDRFDSALESAEESLLARSRSRHLAAPDKSSTASFAPFCKSVDLIEGEYVCREGDASTSIYFVQSGAFEVLKTGVNGDEIRLAKVGAGAMMGEMAQYSGVRRSASIRAVTSSRILEMDEDGQRRMRAEAHDVAGQLDRMVIENLVATVSRANRALAAIEQG